MLWIFGSFFSLISFVLYFSFTLLKELGLGGCPIGLGEGEQRRGAMIMTQWTMDRTGNSQNVAHFYFLLLEITIYIIS